MSAPEKFGGLLFGVDRGEEGEQGQFSVWGCPGVFPMVSWHAQETPAIQGLTHTTKLYHRRFPVLNPQTSSGGKERGGEVAKVSFQVQNHLEVSEHPLALVWPH